MTEQSADQQSPQPRKGGLGRGLGALIPSGPMSGAAGKGHFWSVLDKPPAPADEQPVTDAQSADRTDDQTADQSLDHKVDLQDEQQGEQPAAPTDDKTDDQTDERPTAERADQADDDAAPAAVLIEIDPAQITRNPKNPRQVFDPDELDELAASIKEFGLLQPIVVREMAPGSYELVMGERRLRAARQAQLEQVPAIVRQTDDDAMLRDALLENIHRVQLHPLEEAAAYQQLIDEFGVTHEELAHRIKRSRPAISNSIRLLRLPTRVQNRVAAGVLSGSHARALLGLPNPEDQVALADRIVAEGLSVRATEEAVALAESEPAPRAPRRRKPVAPALAGLAERLSDHFDTRALVQLGRTKGKIIVEFASIDDLERIIAMMAPPLATVRLGDTDHDAD